MSKCMAARHLSFHHLLLRCLPLGASLTEEYPSESGSPLSREDGGELPAPSFVGLALGGLPCRWLGSALAAHPYPMSSTIPILTAEGGHFPLMAGWNPTRWWPGWELAWLDTLPVTKICAVKMPPLHRANPHLVGQGSQQSGKSTQ